MDLGGYPELEVQELSSFVSSLEDENGGFYGIEIRMYCDDHPPPHFHVRYDASIRGLPIEDFVRALRAEGAIVDRPRYPLLHQQPLFTEGHWATIARLTPTDRDLPTYDPRSLPRTATRWTVSPWWLRRRT